MDTSCFETLDYRTEAGIATITLRRPDRLNAFTTRMAAELVAAIDAVDADDGVRAVVVTGSGRAFCAGADLEGGAATFEPANMAVAGNAPQRDPGGVVTLRLFACLKPVIAAVNGPAVGVGATMLLPMDVRLATPDARFGFVFARRGIVPDGASSWFLPRVVGIGQALEWILTGRVFDAATALRAGLVKDVVAPDELLPTAYALAREIIDTTAPVSVALSRQLLWRMLGSPHPIKAHQLESRTLAARGTSADVAEGVTAFLEKRPPAFPDRVSSGLPDVWDGGCAARLAGDKEDSWT